ncbi:MAG: hypothetical protein JSV35_06685 [Candidatus Bathyarchaeota archaeon]|nr:MAG: hypothetical protein JSV35_06685 [Candidatus Bathyarchaeota archaeon]
MVNGLKARLVKRRRDVLLTLAWITAVTVLIIATHRTFYITDIRFATYNIPYLSYLGPAFSELALLALIMVGIIVGTFLSDMKRLVYSYFMTMISSSVLAGVYVYLFIWFHLGFEANLSQIAFGWELAIWWSVVNVFKIMVPNGVILSFLGVVIGTVVRTVVSP